MGIGFALIAVGAAIAFTFTGRFLGLDPDVLGTILMVAGGLALALALLRARRSAP